MDIKLEPGKYVIAVSGGVDSVVLLSLLAVREDLQLTVAHFDHGIRLDSVADRRFVQQQAERYGLRFFYEEGKLGSHASEALAREKRYDFLRRVKVQSGAQAIVTAHHQDDRIETAILNLLRSTGRRGLSSLKDLPEMRRPLLGLPKQDIVTYAQAHNIAWREDSTNSDTRYLRNYVRKYITTQLSADARKQFLQYVDRALELNPTIDALITELLAPNMQKTTLNRQWFIGLPYVVSAEVLRAWLRTNHGIQPNRQQTEKMVVLAKILTHGKLIDVDAVYQLKITTEELALVPRER